jgi:hypothetical protein
VHLAQEALGDRQLLESPDAVLRGAHVVPYFLHVVLVLRLAEELGLGLEGEEVDERGPGALYARGEEPLPALALIEFHELPDIESRVDHPRPS